MTRSTLARPALALGIFSFAMVAYIAPAKACDNKHVTAQATTAQTVAAPAPTMTAPIPVTPTVYTSGLWAFFDPETGTIYGSMGIIPTEDQMPRVSPEELVPQVMPDGSLMIDLKGTFQEYLMLTIDPLGKRYIRCAQDAKHMPVPMPFSPTAYPER